MHAHTRTHTTRTQVDTVGGLLSDVPHALHKECRQFQKDMDVPSSKSPLGYYSHSPVAVMSLAVCIASYLL